MEVLPEGEYFVGTRGGGMDHAAVLACRAGNALLIRFAPVSAESIPIPSDWAFLVAHSLTTAEKSGAVRAEYNSRRTAGTRPSRNWAFARITQPSMAAPSRNCASSAAGLTEAAAPLLSARDGRSAARRRSGECASARRTPIRFGALLNESHASLRDLLAVSNAELDSLVEAARREGAWALA